ncbi:hypothetical protein PsYK624_075850 [Phanerochaete sordida]|uniref:Uncharacterized protein n=1 Tax=Phanerochaete sordida TaxID=48140 RepID=A0A9P3LDN3_9APHY|nr:hypothetical protein PsYK624_075850 [Phanerochaete sordida]
MQVEHFKRELETLTRAQLQWICKKQGQRANGKDADMINIILEMYRMQHMSQEESEDWIDMAKTEVPGAPKKASTRRVRKSVEVKSPATKATKAAQPRPKAGSSKRAAYIVLTDSENDDEGVRLSSRRRKRAAPALSVEIIDIPDSSQEQPGPSEPPAPAPLWSPDDDRYTLASFDRMLLPSLGPNAGRLPPRDARPPSPDVSDDTKERLRDIGARRERLSCEEKAAGETHAPLEQEDAVSEQPEATHVPVNQENTSSQQPETTQLTVEQENVPSQQLEWTQLDDPYPPELLQEHHTRSQLRKMDRDIAFFCTKGYPPDNQREFVAFCEELDDESSSSQSQGVDGDENGEAEYERQHDGRQSPSQGVLEDTSANYEARDAAIEKMVSIFEEGLGACHLRLAGPDVFDLREHLRYIWTCAERAED